MKELDLLKKDWQKNDHSSSQFSENDIYRMLHKKSSSIVKWILIISVLEVLIWTSISVLFNTDDFYKEFNNDIIVYVVKGINFFNYGVIIIFIYLFYKNYKNITTTVATKQLMKDILKTRKTVQYYVWYNLGMMLMSFIAGLIIAFVCNPEIIALKDKFDNPKIMIITILILIAFTAVFFGVFWLFYRLIYGTLLRRLHKNYEELKKIDL